MPLLKLVICLAGIHSLSAPAWAQTAVPLPQGIDLIDPTEPIVPSSPLPQIPPALPPPEELLQTPATPDLPSSSPASPATIAVERYNIVGSTVFSPDQLAEVVRPFTGPSITFAQLLQARSAVTQKYIDAGYVTSGAYLAEQVVEKGIVTLQVVEGQVQEIEIIGNRRLRKGYVRDRIKLALGPPLNTHRLLEAMRLLQIDPLIANISAELSAGLQPGMSLLRVTLKEAPSFDVHLALDNSRSPGIGGFQRQIVISEANVLGFGDGAQLGFANTDGSNQIDFSYSFPVNARNGTVSANFSQVWSRVVQEPFDILNIEGTARNLSLAFRQPIWQTPRQELALGIALGRQESETFLGGTADIPKTRFSLSPGADVQGRTQITPLQFFQEFQWREPNSIFSARSEFGIGLDAFATINDTPPDGRFFLWRGQVQWAKQLKADTLLLLRSNLQFADRPLVALQQAGLGGPSNVRGYPANLLLVDNSFFASGELRLPIARFGPDQGLLQIAPFFDIGYGWYNGTLGSRQSSTLAAVGLGLRWQWSDLISARLDWGIPLLNAGPQFSGFGDSQLFFSIIVSPW